LRADVPWTSYRRRPYMQWTRDRISHHLLFSTHSPLAIESSFHSGSSKQCCSSTKKPTMLSVYLCIPQGHLLQHLPPIPSALRCQESADLRSIEPQTPRCSAFRYRAFSLLTNRRSSVTLLYSFFAMQGALGQFCSGIRRDHRTMIAMAFSDQ
jgi:hypothetical protein